MKNSKEYRLNSNVWEFFFPQVQTPKSNFFIYIVPWQQVQFPLSTEYGASWATWISPLKSCFLLPFTNQNTIKLKTNNLFLAANMGHSPECASPKPVSHTSPDQKELAPHILSIRGFLLRHWNGACHPIILCSDIILQLRIRANVMEMVQSRKWSNFWGKQAN